RRRGQDDRLRHPLPGRGRRVRRPGGAHGPRPDRGRRPGHRDQGPGGAAHHPRHAARRPARGPRRTAGRAGGGPARRGGRADLRRLRRRHPRPAGRVPGGARHRDQRRRAGGGLPGAHLRRRRRGARPGGPGGEGGIVTATAYTRLEVLRTFRNRRFFIFSLVFPFVLYLLLAAPNRDETDFLNSGVSAPLYYMVGLIAFGTMVAVIAGGARIAAERSVGWNRQLRLTPLTVPAYFRTK